MIDQLTEMTTMLRTGGLDAFLQRSRQQGWTSPKMFSAWYISHLPNDPDGFKKVEEAKSQFGLEFARQLSVVAKSVRETKEMPLLERTSESLFTAVDWLGHEVAYGNLFLQDRAYDIAAVAVTKLVIDLSYPPGRQRCRIPGPARRLVVRIQSQRMLAVARTRRISKLARCG